MPSEKRSKYETIIIGGGISGLACARTLAEAGQEFIIISENIGGSIQTSEDEQVNYGAYYVTEDYFHVNQFVTLGRPISQSNIMFHTNQSSYTSFGKKVFGNYQQFSRYKNLLNQFRPRFNAFRKRAEVIGQVGALKEDKWLFELYNKSAEELIKENDFKEFVDYYIGQIIFATAFTPASEITAFDLLWLSLPITLKTYEFSFHSEAITAPFRERIVFDSVTKIEKHTQSFSVTSRKGGIFSANNVVVATPTHISQRLLNLPSINKPTSVYMSHLKGKLKKGWGKRTFNFFFNESDVRVIAQQANGTFIVYSHLENPDFTPYFEDYSIIAKKHWNPAFNLQGNALIPCVQDNGLYLIGAQNICSLEDSYIIGIFAAKQIIGK